MNSTGAAADKNTLFYIASATKAFTALSIALLVDDGLLKWDEPIKNYISSFETADQYITENTTMIDVLAHRTGIAEFPILSDATVARDALFERMKEYAPNKAFRTAFQYSNSMYAIAGYIVELLTGMQWEEFVTKRILTPLELRHSDFAFLSEWEHPNRSKLYFLKDHIMNRYSGSEEKTYDTWGPAGSIHSNTYDILQMGCGLVCCAENIGGC